MRRPSRPFLAWGLAIALGCGSRSTTFPAGGGPGPGTANLGLQLAPRPTSADYTAVDLDVARVLLFYDRAPAAAATGSSCAAAGGTPFAGSGTARLDLRSAGATLVATMAAPSGALAEAWLLTRAAVTKHGRAHAAHGELSCVGDDGRLYSVLRLRPASPLSVSDSSRPILAAAFDPRAHIHEQGDCDRSCDEDDQHLANPDPQHGWISLAQEYPAERAGDVPADTPPSAPAAPPSTPASGPPAAGAATCSAGAACTCQDASSCALDCPGGGCRLACERTGTCRLTCPGGNCTMSCQDAGTCETTCTGNGCQVRCAGSGSCALSQCTSGCALTCHDAGSCACNGNADGHC